METLIIIGIILLCVILFIAIVSESSYKGIEKQLTKMGKAVANAQKNILDENEEVLKETANKNADINKEAVKSMASAVKDGFSEGEIYCKHCGASIDSDSKFCKKCGKEQ